MSIEQEEHLITGEEYGRERRRLIQAQVPDDAPEFRALRERVIARDNYLFERYGKPYLHSHPGKWIAISLDGRTLFRDTAGEASWAADEEFGIGNHTLRKLAEFPGHDFSSVCVWTPGGGEFRRRVAF